MVMLLSVELSDFFGFVRMMVEGFFGPSSTPSPHEDSTPMDQSEFRSDREPDPISRDERRWARGSCCNLHIPHHCAG